MKNAKNVQLFRAEADICRLTSGSDDENENGVLAANRPYSENKDKFLCAV